MLRETESKHTDPVLEREFAYYEDLYGGFGAGHFEKPAVVAFRRYLVDRMVRTLAINGQSRVLSIGCGIGDTELLLARHARHVTGIDLSPTAIRSANRAAGEAGAENARFIVGSWPMRAPEAEPYDAVIAIFFLHHLHDAALAAFPQQVLPLLCPGGRFYALEPSSRRLSGFLGKLLVPTLMKKYQTEDERQLQPDPTTELFHRAGFVTQTRWFDFCSTPLAGLFPSWAFGYRLARGIDGALTACRGIRALSSNFELIAQRPRIAESS